MSLKISRSAAVFVVQKNSCKIMRLSTYKITFLLYADLFLWTLSRNYFNYLQYTAECMLTRRLSPVTNRYGYRLYCLTHIHRSAQVGDEVETAKIILFIAATTAATANTTTADSLHPKTETL